MTDWKEKLLNKVTEVVKHGWGSVNVGVTKKGERIALKQTFDDIIENKEEVVKK